MGRDAVILPEHLPHHRRLKAAGAFEPLLLMLGNQEDRTGQAAAIFGAYTTLDPDGGDLRLDMNEDLTDLAGRFGSVFNLGTLEHVWDVRQAYVNAARAVRLGGTFAGHGPVSGYQDHGVHVTDWRFVEAFLTLNGFRLLDSWLTDQQGNPVGGVVRGSGNVLHWCVARRERIVERFRAPQQVFRGGVPC